MLPIVGRLVRELQRPLLQALAHRTFDPDDLPDVVPCLWSRGVGSFCDFGGPPGYARAPTESVAAPALLHGHYRGARGLVWVRLSTQNRDGRLADLDHFVAQVLPTIERPFVLVTTDGDVSVPSQLRTATAAALLASPWLRAWYTQNHDGGGHGRIRPWPIGLDLHTPRPFSSPRRLLEDLAALAARRRPVLEQPLRVYDDTGVSLASQDRIDAMRALRGCAHIEQTRYRLPQKECWQRYTRHPFVLSLAGYALDCHRTWEALYLGCIVITRASSLAPLYEGLPVVQFREWDELRDTGQLARWREQLAPLADPPRIWRLLHAPSRLQAIRQACLPDVPGCVAESAPLEGTQGQRHERTGGGQSGTGV